MEDGHATLEIQHAKHALLGTNALGLDYELTSTSAELLRASLQ